MHIPDPPSRRRRLRILVASKLDPGALDRLRAEHDVVCAFRAPEDRLLEVIPDRQVLAFRSGVQINERVLAAAPQLELLIRAGSGLDNLHLPTVRARGLRLERIPEPGARAVAELAFGFMLMLARQIGRSDSLLRQGRWTKGELDGFLLRGKTLGIVGAGNIGGLVGQMARAWGMDVQGCVGLLDTAQEARLQGLGIRPATLDEVLSTSDFVAVHVPLSPATRGLLDARALARMKPGAFLVNLARGGVVDEEALHRELTTAGRLRGAALDVHAAEGEGRISPLAVLDNVVLTPHIGATTLDTQREIGERVLELVDQLAAAPAPTPTPGAP